MFFDKTTVLHLIVIVNVFPDREICHTKAFIRIYSGLSAMQSWQAILKAMACAEMTWQ